MKVAKKILLPIMIIAVFLVGSFSVTAYAKETIHPTGDPLSYTVLDEDEKTVAVSDCESGEKNITIPATVEGYTVTEIEEDMFKGYSTLETLTFADGCNIETIEGAFNNCTGLKEINWGKNSALKEITNSFKSCVALEELEIPNSIETIGKHSFSNCLKLEKVSFEAGSNLKEIGKEAFAYLGKDDEVVPATISTLTLPASLETLDESAFHCIPVEHFSLENNSKLAEIPDGFLAADGAEGAPGTETVCYSLWDYIKKAYVSLTSPYPSTPAKVAKACDCLTSVDFGDQNSLTRIGMGAFKNQTHLTSIDFGEDTKAEELTIDRGAFIAVGNNAYASEEEALTDGFDTFVFPANLKELGTGAFQLARIKNVVFPEGCKLEEIPDNFLGVNTGGGNGTPPTSPKCVAANCLETISLGKNNSISRIGYAAFYNQSHVTSIDFGTSDVELTIDSAAFVGVGNNANYVNAKVDAELNDGIEKLVLPANLSFIGEGAFNLSRVKNLEFSNGCRLGTIPNSFMFVTGSLGDPYQSPADIASNCLETINFGQGNSLKTIKYGAFNNQLHLKSIDFGTSGASLRIESGAFSAVGNNANFVSSGVDKELNSGIETLVFPSNLTYIGEGAFNYSRVKNLVFSNGCKLETIPNSFMFVSGSIGHPSESPMDVASNCLETINFGLGNSLKTINYGAFNNQTHITSINFGAYGPNLTINYGAFGAVGNNASYVNSGIDKELNSGIETLVFPANLSTVYEGAFSFARIKNVSFADNCRLGTIPTSFMAIDYSGANGRPSTSDVELAANCLESINFGKNNSLNTINYGAFKNQSYVKSIDFGSSNSNLTINYGAFVGVGNNGYLVDCGKAKAYNEGIDTLVMPKNLYTLNEGAFDEAKIKNLKFEDECRLSVIPSSFLGVKANGSNGYPSKSSIYDDDKGRYVDTYQNDSLYHESNSLETIDFGDNYSLTTINYGAFFNQSHVKSIDFGTNGACLTINYGAFIGVGNNGWLYDQGVDTEFNEGIETLTLPSNVTTVNSGAFDYARIKNFVVSDNSGLTSIPSGFLAIAFSSGNALPGLDSAELAANALETITFGKNIALSEISYGAFKNQSHVTSIVFGEDSNNLTINYGAFIGVGNNAYLVKKGIDKQENAGIETLILPSHLETLNEGAFDYARIKNIKFSDNCQLSTIPNGFMQIGGSGVKAYTEVERAGANYLESVDFGKDNSLTLIDNGAFNYQTHLTSINFGNNKNSDVLVLDEGSFQGLGDIKEFVIGDNCQATELTEGAISKCESLTTVNLKDSHITAIDDALKENPNLTTVIFPQTLKSITWSKYISEEDIAASVPEETENRDEVIADKINDNKMTCMFYGSGNVNRLVFAAADSSEYTFDDNVLQFVNETGVVCIPISATDAQIEQYKVALTKAGLSFEEGKWTIHKFSAWTSNEDGTQSRTCEYCNGVQTNECTYTAVVTPPTYTEMGYTTYTCSVCGDSYKADYVDVLVMPEIIEGANQSISKNSNATFRSSAPISTFITVKVDGVEISADNYDVYEGSTIVTLKKAYISTLSVGTHKLEIVSTTGNAATEFTVENVAGDTSTKSPETGAPVYVTGTLSVLGAIALFVTFVRRKSENQA